MVGALVGFYYPESYDLTRTDLLALTRPMIMD